MQSTKLIEQSKSTRPILPAPLALPLKIIPDSVHSGALAATLNRVFKSELEAGDMDFLLGRSVSISIHDAAVSYRLTLSGKRLKAYGGRHKCDLSIQAALYDYMSLVSRQEDPDTLVFQRRLVMEGDTELGLSLKNYLDGMDIESSMVLPFIEALARKTLPVYKTLFA
jgi:predicted lipid carrier protein YhbT